MTQKDSRKSRPLPQLHTFLCRGPHMRPVLWVPSHIPVSLLLQGPVAGTRMWYILAQSYCKSGFCLHYLICEMGILMHENMK